MTTQVPVYYYQGGLWQFSQTDGDLVAPAYLGVGTYNPNTWLDGNNTWRSITNIDTLMSGVGVRYTNNSSNGTTNEGGYGVKDTTGAEIIRMSVPGSGNTQSTWFGLSRPSGAFLWSNNGRDFAIGTLDNKSVIFGTNNTSYGKLWNTGNWTFGGVTDEGFKVVINSSTGTDALLVKNSGLNEPTIKLQNSTSYTLFKQYAATGLQVYTLNGFEVYTGGSTSSLIVDSSQRVIIGVDVNQTGDKFQVWSGTSYLGGNTTINGAVIPNIYKGDFSNASPFSRAYFQTTTSNATTLITAIPSGTATSSALELFNSSDSANYTSVRSSITSASVRYNQTILGTGSYIPFQWGFGGNFYFTLYTTGRTWLGPSPVDDGVSTLAVNGVVRSVTGGFKFPDNTVQTTAATSAGGKGTATIDFGAHPGTNKCAVTITGQTGFDATNSVVQVQLSAEASGNHTASDATYIAPFLHLTTGTYVTGTGFSIYARSEHRLEGTFVVRWVWF